MAALGCRGWTYDECLPNFRRHEDCRFSASPARGKGGPIGVTRIAPDPISEAFLAACVQHGYPRVDDYNDADPDGASYLQLSAADGWRSSAASGYLRPVLQRPNLTVRTDALARRIVFRRSVATGVAFTDGGGDATAEASREVILAAGGVRSPALLERSGIGARGRLEALSIEVVADRAEVGENLQDHFMPRICFETTEPGTVNNLFNSSWIKVREALTFLTTRRGLFGDSLLRATAYARSDPAQALPDLRIQVGLMSAEGRIPVANPAGATPAARNGLDPNSSFHIGVYGIYPQARGSVHIRNADAAAPLAVRPNYLGTDADRRALVSGLRLVYALAKSAPLAAIVTREIRPGLSAATDADVLAFAQRTGHTCWHPAGTCRMGDDAGAVVDEECRVRGVERLRVVDASVFPLLTSSNTNVPVLMLAERIADRMRGAGASA
jgi:choline dehydrogenase